MKNQFGKVIVIGVVMLWAFSSLSFLEVEASPQQKVKKVNINTASLSELQTLPRIGEKVAQRIIDFRKEHGSFKRIEELMKVKGIGEKMFNQIKPLITVGQVNTKK